MYRHCEKPCDFGTTGSMTTDGPPMRFAFVDGKLVDARRESGVGRKRRYECVKCPNKHEVHLVNAKAARYNEPAWFRHNGDIGKHGNNGAGGNHNNCGSGGESAIHWHAKFLLQSKVGSYLFVTADCEDCNTHKIYLPPSSCTVKVEESDVDAGYRYDAMLIDGTFTTVLEVFHTHQTSPEKQKHVRDRGWTFAEFRAEDIIRELDVIQDMNTPVMLDNLRARFFVCQRCQRARDIRKQYEAWHDGLRVEINVWSWWESQLEAYNLRIIELAKRMPWLIPFWQMMACTGPRVAEIDSHGLAMIHDMDRTLSIEMTWEECHRKEGINTYNRLVRQLKGGRRLMTMQELRRVGRLKAVEHAELKQAPREREQYVKGEMTKCPECKWWVNKLNCGLVHAEYCGRNWFEEARHLKWQNSIWVCRRCSIGCCLCGNVIPLEQALQYGLCLKCNMRDGGKSS